MTNYDMDTEALIREVIGALNKPTDLADFAKKRHGFGDSNGGFGVVYPGDLDEYQREIEGLSIPEGMVEIYGYWGLPNGYEKFVREADYLSVLACVLREQGDLRKSDAILSLMLPST